MSRSTVSLEVSDGVAVLVLDRPEQRNAFTATMAHEIVAACDAVDADDAVRALVVTGRGRSFCVGADLSGGPSTFEHAAAEKAAAFGTVAGAPRDRGGVVALRFAALDVPVIAAVNGAAVGVGATMVLPMDVRIAATSARFGFPFARRGIVPEGASSWFLPRLVGIAQAMEWAVAGRVFDADEALRGRLVSRVVADDTVVDTALALAREIAENASPVSVAVTRRLMWSMLGAASPWEAHALDSRAILELGAGPDAAEGVASFLEKRPPGFTARRTRDHTGLGGSWPAVPSDVEVTPGEPG